MASKFDVADELEAALIYRQCVRDRAPWHSHDKGPAPWIWLILGLLLVLALGCQSRQVLPSPNPRTQTPTVAALATRTAVPTATVFLPGEPYPPTIVDYSPRPGEEVMPSATALSLLFDQPMDKESVAAALRFVPDVEGDLTWESDTLAIFRPKALASATRYRIIVGEEARSTAGVPLSSELAFTFSTLSPLAVTDVSPKDGARDLRVDTPLLITFNRAVVPINCVGQAAEAEGPCRGLSITLTPSVTGEGYWVNSAVYRFSPTEGWRAGQAYDVVLSADTVSVDGAPLPGRYAWSFETAAPRIVDVAPGRSEKGVPLDVGLQVQFNTPMDKDRTASGFSLTTAEGAAVPGLITWEDNGARLIFTPTHLLDLGTTYRMRVGEGARAVTSAPLDVPWAWSFTTVPEPRLVSSTPTDGAGNVDIYQPLRLTFAGAIDEASLRAGVTVSATQDTGVIYRYYDAASGVYTLSWERRPRTEYCVDVSPGVADIYGNDLAASESICFVTGDLPPKLELAWDTYAVTLSSERDARVYLTARNVNRARFRLSEIETSTLMQHRAAAGSVLREWTESFDTALNSAEAVPVMLRQGGGALPTGLYRLSWSIPGERGSERQVDIAVIDRNVTLKIAAEEALVWVTDLESGEPISKTAVQLVDSDGLLIAGATTDLEGLAHIPLQPLDGLWRDVAAITGVTGEEAFGFTLASWHGDVPPWAFGLETYTGMRVPYRLFLHTDRPLYRPADTVRFHGVLREEHDAQYSLPQAGTTLTLTLREPSWAPILTQTVAVSSTGDFAGTFLIPREVPNGAYTLEATMPVEGSDHVLPLALVDFTVASYRKPLFEVNVTPDVDLPLRAGDGAEEDGSLGHVLQGGTARFNVEARYFAGGPVLDSDLTWTLWAEPHAYAQTLRQDGREAWRRRDLDGWSWGSNDAWPAPALVARGTVALDREGRAVVEVPAELVPLGEAGSIASQRWTLQATVTDESGLSALGSGHLTVHAVDVYLGLRPESWISVAKEPVTIKVQALDWEGKGVGRQELEVTFALRTWYPVPEQHTWAYTDTVEAETTLMTRADGSGEVKFTPPTSGSYVVTATTRGESSMDHQAVSSVTLWAGGRDAVPLRDDESSVEVIADAHSYRVGDTARIMVPTGIEGAYQMLLTVEREGILEVQRLEFDEPNAVIDLPIAERYVPNVYVSCTVVVPANARHNSGMGVDAQTVQPPNVRVGYAELIIEPNERLLQVEVVPDAATYEPGDTAALTVRVSDALGNPVAADVSLAVVDQALLALQPRPSASESQEAGSLLDVFYGAKPLQVITGNGLLHLMDRLEARIEALGLPVDDSWSGRGLPGMGGAAEGGDERLEIRQDFPEIALWQVQLHTDASGVVTTQFDLPDNLTTWVAKAYAITADTEVGEGEAVLPVSKPLYVQPITPRFVVVGDRVELAAMVHNTTSEPLDVDVWLESDTTISLEAPEHQALMLAPGQRRRVSWVANVTSAGRDAVDLTFAARSGTYEDASRPTVGTLEGLPLKRYISPDVMRVSGTLSEAGSSLEALIIPGEATGATTLNLRVDPSLTATWLEQELSDYLEKDGLQTVTSDAWVSRLLPAVARYVALSELGADGVEIESTRLVIADTLDRLYAHQNADGGWGWGQDVSNVHLTSYAILGLQKAEDAGFPLRREAVKRALDYVARLTERGLDAGVRYPHFAFGLYVMSETGQPWPQGAAATLYADRDELGLTGRAFLAMALGRADPSDTRVATLLTELQSASYAGGSGVHWEESDAQHWVTPAQATAVVLEALVQLAPEDDQLAQVARWLIAARRGATWTTPYETAWVTTALADYVALTGEAAYTYGWGVALNGVPVATSGTDDDAALSGRTVAITLASENGAALQRGLNLMEFSRDAGEGQLYYTAQLSMALPLEEVQAEQRGLMLVRDYCRVTSESGIAEADDPCDVDHLEVGDLVEVHLTLTVPETRYFVQVQDHFPAGFELVDTTVSTELELSEDTQGMPRPLSSHGENGVLGAPLAADALEAEWNYSTPPSFRDDRAEFFVQELSPGVYRVSYYLRASLPGVYHALPAMASEYYFPEVWGRSAPAVLEVTAAP